MNRQEYWARWDSPLYGVLVEALAKKYNSNGCTGVPDFYLIGCWEHDIAYRTQTDPYGEPITRREADKRFRWYIQLRSPFGIFSLMSWWRWVGVRILGSLWWAKWRKVEAMRQRIAQELAK